MELPKLVPAIIVLIFVVGAAMMLQTVINTTPSAMPEIIIPTSTPTYDYFDSNGIYINKSQPTASPTPTPTPQRYVTCSEYQLITDKYKTPSGFYIVAGNETELVSEATYNNFIKGEYAKTYSWWKHRNEYSVYYNPYAPAIEIDEPSLNLRQVTESESGYRDACEIVRRNEP